MSDEFLKALYRISDGEYKIIEMYKVGKDIGIPNKQVDDIVNDLSNIGLIKKIGETKILLTFEGKQEVESSKMS
jgi:Mn-dependent DtxR family transcriptional regulator